MGMVGCNHETALKVVVHETSAAGRRLEKIAARPSGSASPLTIVIHPEQEFQSILGFGGSFTEATAHVLGRLSAAKRRDVLEAYFGASGARYTLARTHINSCDFSLGHYSYAPVAGDADLSHFSIQEDMDDLLPLIRDAQILSEEGFRLISSPWTAPPWMKDNQDWRGGRLLPQFYPTWALFFLKYIQAYKDQGIDVWGITVENEPLGNDNNWESMHYTPEEMNDFVKNHLCPLLRSQEPHVKILGYDQNRDEELYRWTDAMYDDPEAKKCYDGMAVHWYASTFDYFPEALQYAHRKAPNKYLIQTEACVDAETPRWRDDAWYWTVGAKDWGWDWAPADKKHLHPRYAPVHRYARDIIGCLNNRVNGWIDWNMALDKQGGPNWFKNWCVAPVIVDPDLDEVYFSPLYYVMAHFSRFIRPGAVRIGLDNPDSTVMFTAVRNPDGALTGVLFNPSDTPKAVQLKLRNSSVVFDIPANAIQTIEIQ